MSRIPKLAARNVGRNRRRTLITGAAILLGVAAITVLRGFVVGAQDMMVNDAVLGRSGALQIHRKGYMANVESAPLTLNMPYTEEFKARITGVAGVKGVTGRIQFQGLVGNGLSQTTFLGRGIDIATEKDACPRADQQLKAGGRPLTAEPASQALVGYELAQGFGVAVDGSVNVQTQSPQGRANAMQLKINGLTVSSLPFENKRVLSVPLGTAQMLLGMQGKVTEFAVSVEDLKQVNAVAQRLSDTLGTDYEVHTWKEVQPFVRDVINRQNFVMTAVSALLAIIVLTGIVNTMLMSVFERVREIGTLLAIGLRRKQILFMFVIEGALIGVLGGLSGALVGKAVVSAIAWKGLTFAMSGTSGQQTLRPDAPLGFLVAALGVAVLGALAASLWPAWKASRLNPVDALRGA